MLIKDSMASHRQRTAATKRSIWVDGGGGPHGVVVFGANLHDARLLGLLLEGVV